MGELFIGTSGYYYDEWKSVFYPKEIKKDDYISFYANQFDSVEINSSYYNIPKPQNIISMLEKSEYKLRISIKANRQLTHEIDYNNWTDPSAQFISAIEPIFQNKLLLSVLFQFPQSFHYDDKNRIYLAALLDFFSALPLIVEFRHDSWLKDSVYKTLNEKNVGFCICDMPDLKHLPKFEPIITGENAYIRFHGRNNDNWYGTNSRDRYDYLYSDEELSHYCYVIKLIQSKAKVVQIYFNNHAKGNATVNAKKLKLLLT